MSIMSGGIAKFQKRVIDSTGLANHNLPPTRNPLLPQKSGQYYRSYYPQGLPLQPGMVPASQPNTTSLDNSNPLPLSRRESTRDFIPGQHYRHAYPQVSASQQGITSSSQANNANSHENRNSAPGQHYPQHQPTSSVVPPSQGTPRNPSNIEKDRTQPSKKSRKTYASTSGPPSGSPQVPPPQAPGPIVLDTGDFMAHWTAMFNQVHQDMQVSYQAQVEVLESLSHRLGEGFDEIRQELRSGLSGVRRTSGSDADTESDSDRDQSPRRRKAHRPQEIVTLQGYIRAHLKGLLMLPGITKAEDFVDSPPPLTEEEHRLFNDKHPNAPPPPLIANDNFRIDFTRGMSESSFNQVARDEFTTHFLNALNNGSYTEKGSIPEAFRTRKHVAKCLDTTVRYIRQVYRGVAHDPRLRAQAQRRDTLALSRRRACSVRGGSLNRHLCRDGILEVQRRDLMSGDETDSSGPPKSYRILRPTWQSDEVAQFFWKLDQIDREHWRHPPHSRATPGNPLRTRLPPERGKAFDTRPPTKLWRNCYHPTYLKNLRPWELRGLKMIDADYDFSIEQADL